MDRNGLVTLILGILVLSTGCLGALDDVGSDPKTSNEACINVHTDVDPVVQECLISKRSPDLGYTNHDTRPHNLSVEIVRNGTAIVYSKNVTIEGASEPDMESGAPGGVLQNVIDQPGDYEFVITVDGENQVTMTESFDRRYAGIGRTEWGININQSGYPSIMEYGHN